MISNPSNLKSSARQTFRLVGFKRRRLHCRRGISTIASILITVIGIATLMLVVNWTYLNLARTRTQQLAETLAFSAVQHLLDDELLADPLPSTGQADDFAAAENAIVTPLTGLLAQNNAASGERLRVDPDTDLQIAAGRVENASAPVNGSNFTLDPGNDLFNTLQVEISRPASGANPVQLLIRGMGAPDAATIVGVSYATLDSRVVAFRPTTALQAPVAPLALSASAWFSERVTGGVDSNGNDRLELRARLRTGSGAGDHNAALIGMQPSPTSLNMPAIPAQIAAGIAVGDVDAGGLFGPATASSPFIVDAERNSPANVAAIRDALNDVAASPRPLRVFPVYSAFNDPLSIREYIGARVLGASIENISGEGRLVVRLEPDFVLHPTVVTAFEYPPQGPVVPENTYVHKIRLTR